MFQFNFSPTGSAALRSGVLSGFLLVLASHDVEGQESFLRGDVNVDGRVSLSDAVTLNRFQFIDGIHPPCLDAADVNDDATPESRGRWPGIDFPDVVNILARLFMGWLPPISEPFPDVGPDPTLDKLSCESYEVVEPTLSTDNVLRLGQVEGQPGELVLVPVYLTSKVAVEAIQLVIRYDPALFEEFGGHGGFLAAGIKEIFAYSSTRPQDGVIVTGWMKYFGTSQGAFPLPPGENVHVGNVPVLLRDDVPPGTSIDLELVSGHDSSGVGPYRMVSEITHRDAAIFASTVPRTVPGQLKVVPDVVVFLRGDVNGDRGVDASDAVSILRYLFLGEAGPNCLDAADVNDDGRINIGDPINLLTTVFRGTVSIADPYPLSGSDPTEDDLDDCRLP